MAMYRRCANYARKAYALYIHNVVPPAYSSGREGRGQLWGTNVIDKARCRVFELGCRVL
jgi:hypothetical protein